MLKLTDKEKFLMDIQAYLMNGGVVYDENVWDEEEQDFLQVERTQMEALEIMDDVDRFLKIDVINDELDFYGLSIDDFEWEE